MTRPPVVTHVGTCLFTGKVRYRDQLAARLALAMLTRQDKASRPKAEQRAYRCHTCRGWHLTSERKR